MDAFDISLNKAPDMNYGNFKKLRNSDDSSSSDFTAVITAKISTSIQDLKAEGNSRAASINAQSVKVSSGSVEKLSAGTPDRKINTISSAKKPDAAMTASNDKASLSDEKIKTALSKFEKGVNEKLQETLDVSEEDIKDAMEELGLSYSDLTDASNLSLLLMTLTGAEDQSALLSLDGFSDIKNAIGELSAELFAVTGLNSDQLKEAENLLSSDIAEAVPVEVTAEAPQNEDAPLNQGVLDTKDDTAKAAAMSTESTDDAAKTAPLEEKPENTEAAGKAAAQRKTADEETAEKPVDVTDEEITDVSAEKKENVRAEVKAASGNEIKDDKEAEAEGEGNELKDVLKAEPSSQSTRTEQNPTGNQLNQGAGNHGADASALLNNQTVDVFNEVPEVPVTPYSQQNINPAEIAQQMVRNVRTAVTESIRTMEVQLNPENLGRMIIHVSEQNGQLTARINLENENVRTAMEEQMAIVKQNLEAQGLKVESVSVTADAHEFERNLEEGNAPKEDLAGSESNESRNFDEEGQERRGVGSINMNELSSGEVDIADLNDDERLAAQIMRENGNTLNINA